MKQSFKWFRHFEALTIILSYGSLNAFDKSYRSILYYTGLSVIFKIYKTAAVKQ